VLRGVTQVECHGTNRGDDRPEWFGQENVRACSGLGSILLIRKNFRPPEERSAKVLPRVGYGPQRLALERKFSFFKRFVA